MTLKEQLLSRKTAVARRWLDRSLDVYPSDVAAFFGRERDPFSNPAGHAIADGIRGLLDGLLGEVEPDELRARLEPILKIRAVQSLSASQAVAFVFLLKDVIRAELGRATTNPELAVELVELENRIDQLGLVAFDVYTHWRERVHEVGVNEVQRRLSGLMASLGIDSERLRVDP
jgi:hypothetical protein